MSNRRIGALLSYLNIFIQAVLGFVYVPLLLHYMGKHEYGLYQLMGSVVAYLAVMDFGLSTTTVRFYSKYKALKDTIKMENLLALMQRIYAGIICFMLLVGATIYNFLDVIFANGLTAAELVQAKHIFLLLMVNVGVTLFGLLYQSVINSNERFIFLRGLSTIQLIVQPLAVIAVMQQWPTALAMVAVLTVMNLIMVMIKIWYAYSRLKVKIVFHYFDKDIFNQAKVLAFAVFGVAIADQIFWKTNQIILGAMWGTAEVAVYSIASLIYMNYMALSLAISGVFLPHVTEMVTNRASNKDLSDLMIKIGRLQTYLLGLVLGAFIVFGRQFIRLWAGDSFLDAYIITIIILIPFTIDLIQNIGLSIMQAKNVYGFRARVYGLLALINIGVAIPMAYYGRGIGAALASGIALFIVNAICMNWYYAYQLHLDIKRFWLSVSSIIISTLILTGIGCIVVEFVSLVSWQWLIVGIMLFTIILFGLYYLFSFNEYERKFFRK